jgi:hypothetical protein
MRSAVLSASILAAAALICGAGAASAAGPLLEPDRVGVQLDHDETVRLGAGPIPALVTKMVPLDRIGAGLNSDTEIYRDERGGVHASLRQVIVEAAEHEDGTVAVYFNVPGTRNGRTIDIYQHWN